MLNEIANCTLVHPMSTTGLFTATAPESQDVIKETTTEDEAKIYKKKLKESISQNVGKSSDTLPNFMF